MFERVRFIEVWKTGLFAVKELCEHFAVSRKTGYKWIGRYRAEGHSGLVDRSRAPHGCPHKTPDEIEAAIVAMKEVKPRWGPKKIIHELRRLEPDRRWPAESTAGEVLKRHGLVEKRKRRSKWKHPRVPPIVATRPNELWTIDFKGQFRLGDGSMCYPLTIQDRMSRYVLCCDGLEGPRLLPVMSSMERLFREVGLPERIRSDNGEPFASHGLAGLTRLNVWWMLLGIAHERIDKGRPDQNGAHERMHRELKAETTWPPAATAPGQQILFRDFRGDYNCHRPNEAIDQRRPAELWSPSPRPYPDRLSDPEYPGHFEVRRVRGRGDIKFRGYAQFVSHALAGHLIGLEPVDDGVWSVIFGRTLLGMYDERARRIIG